LQKRPGAITSAVPQAKTLNAETVTGIATGFLKRIGHKGGLKPKKVSLEEGTYTVEIELKKLAAIVRVDSETHEIKEYEIQSKGEEAPLFALSPKMLLIIVGVSTVVHVALSFGFKSLGM
jgi:predicted DNA-binding antitoxin AbrB/MazE fold protein